MKKHEHIAIGIGEVLLPGQEPDLRKWAVVACDQFTSEPEYWEAVDKEVGDAPSTLRLIYPEVFLGEGAEKKKARIKSIHEHMQKYLDDGLFRAHEGLIYVEREAAGRTRKGLVLCVDLEKYDYSKGSKSLIRATEGTIVDRIPPRVEIREGAPLELPHIMVLIDDPDNTVIGSLTAQKNSLKKVYDFELMMNSGRLRGWAVEPGPHEDSVVGALAKLADPALFSAKYGLPADAPVLLFAMGDGNHSLATAKAIWEKAKEKAGAGDNIMDSGLRYALVELVNLHDSALEFEPIHRVVFDLAADRELLADMTIHYGDRCTFEEVGSRDAMVKAVDAQTGDGHVIGVVRPEGFGLLRVTEPDSNLPVGTLQLFLDGFMKEGGAREIDYVHGTDPVVKLGSKQGNMGFYLPAMDKNDLFKTVILDGALPRKTFSMGEADEKRFYMECRRIG